MIIIHHNNIKNICCGLLLFILLSCMMNNSIDAMPVTMSMARPTAGKIVNPGTLPGNKKNSHNNNNNNLRPSLPTNSKNNKNNMVAPPIITPINNNNNNQNKLEMSSSKNNVPTWWPKHLPSPNHLPSFENLLPTISEKEANDALENNNPMKMDQIVNEWSEKARLATLAGGVSMAMSGAMVNPAFGMEDMPQSPVVVPAPPAEVTPVETVVQYKEIKTSDTVEKIDFAALNALLEKDVLNTIIFNNEGSEAFSIANDGQRYNTKDLPYDPNFFEQVNKKHIQTTVLPKPPPNPLQSLGSGISGFVFGVVLPTLVLSSLIGLVFNGGQQGGGGPMGPMGGPGAMGKSVAKVQMEPDTNTNFEDVAGCDEAKDELVEVVDFLKNTDKYASLGARIPRGVILEGPPGTGKTLLARAVAGEAGVPFFSVSGSEFVEMFVGVGASRVRDLFKQAKENAPCIVFIDEIDAIGKQRAAGGGMGGNDEREQTLNQILTEMDGFEGDSGVIVMAATNRADVLDSALLRPGRFDRRVTVNVADFAGRVAILKVHARNKPFAADVDLEGIARRTVGFSGAELQNLLNEAAIYAAREQTAEITYKNIDDALDRLLVGLAKKNRDAQPLTTKRLVALHEAGHAIVGALTPGYDNVAKVTIIPRSNGAGGLTFFAPSEDRVDSGLYNRAYLEAQIAVALGGRVAEELFYDKGGVTTGASSDLQRVAQTARQMVTAWGLSEVIPPVAIATQQGGPTWSKKTMNKIDEEIFALVNDAYATARGILVEHEDLVRELADKLVEKETVNAPELLVMLKKNKKAQEMTKDKYFSYRADAIPIIKTLPSVLEEIETALAAEEEVTEDAAIKVM